tara:strand:+ start:177 stop:425 length:249 start_codon:yes stop_codon:yes gene_type:complete
MAYEHKENKGSMFPNDQDGNTSRPIHKGTINVDGTLYTISAWQNETKSGKKWLKLQVQLPYKTKEKEFESKTEKVKLDDMPF